MADELPPTYQKWTFEDRRTKYKPEYCQGIVSWFRQGLEDLEINNRIDLPTFQRYAVEIGVTEETLKRWSRAHADFGQAFEFCQTIQQAALIHGTITGKFPAAAGIFTEKNILGWRDKHDIEAPGGVPIQVISQIAAPPNSGNGDGPSE